jgi:phospholipase C
VKDRRSAPAIGRRELLLRLAAGAGAAGLLARCGLMPNQCVPEAADAGVTPARRLLGTVDHLVVLMMENRSFDGMLGALSLDAAYAGAAQVDGLRGNESNPDPAGASVSVFHQTSPEVLNPPHDWNSARAQLDGGHNDGFVRAASGSPRAVDVMAFYRRENLPVTYALADQYTVCDRWFSSVLGPTWPNRFYLHAATSRGIRDNSPVLASNAATIWDHLAQRCRTGKNYYAGTLAWYSGGFLGKSVAGDEPLVPSKIEEFFRDAQDGMLPDFALIDPDFGSGDDHPPRDMRLGQAFIASVVRALAASPQWPRLLFLLVYDEHGGFYDHVPPPTTADADTAFQQLGFRVPALAVGPMVRAGWVDSTPYEHVSVAATLAARFGIASLGRRMDAANDLSPLIDPMQLQGAPPLPPPALPRVDLPLQAVLPAATSFTSQPELEALRARVPRSHVDDRGVEERMATWLRRGQELGAVRLV